MGDMGTNRGRCYDLAKMIQVECICLGRNMTGISLGETVPEGRLLRLLECIW